ncbi:MULTISPECIES: HAD hydrolase-like protein [Paenibacillus]|uniref:Phosphoglycolate phosphatase n=1 Tax=Paenibacillus albilobatus TaxID=2716884 RepID=A0A919XCB2_9BACL|nr:MULTISPECIES: HAD hydrolase-like protein [Paenibacillus]GIO29854.1 phosphoglycolate phosphatase [Paenibacillus albilobatus]
MNILWDFDGTLFDTYPAFTDIFYDILGGDISKEEIYSHLKISMTHAARHFGFTEQQIRDWRNRETVHPGGTPPFSGVEEVLRFADLNVIMTHKPRKEVLEILEYYRWERYFRHIVAGDDGFPRKPDPASYRFLHETYRLDLAIGDREIDILPAKAIGISTCLFQNRTPGADFYLERYEDFFEVIKGCGSSGEKSKAKS